MQWSLIRRKMSYEAVGLRQIILGILVTLLSFGYPSCYPIYVGFCPEPCCIYLYLFKSNKVTGNKPKLLGKKKKKIKLHAFIFFYISQRDFQLSRYPVLSYPLFEFQKIPMYYLPDLSSKSHCFKMHINLASLRNKIEKMHIRIKLII